MNKLIVAAVIFIAFIFYASSCKVKVTPLNSDMKSHFSYKPGSYWIYLDTISGKYDSFSVQSNKNSTENESNTASYEQIEMEIDDRTNTQRLLFVSLVHICSINFSVRINNYVAPTTDFTYPLYIGSSQ